jgi:hypothetical protein
LAQAKEIIRGTTWEGKKLFSGESAEVRVPMGGGSGGSFGVKLTGAQTTVTTSQSTQPNKVWTRLVGGAGLEEGTALTAGTDGSVYVTGVSDSATLEGQTSSGGQDVFLTKFGPDGTKAWTRLIGGAGLEWDFDLTTGTDGSIYSVGYSNSTIFDGQTTQGREDVFITKYSTDGTKVWTQLLGGEYNDWGYAITTGSDGSIYASGVTLSDNLDGQARLGASQGYDAFITKYDPNGTKLWTRRAGGTGQDWGRGITAGTDGSVYVGGFSNSSFDGLTNSGGYDAFVIKYNPDGSKAWTRLVGGSGNETGYALTTGTDGSVYLSGKTASTTFDGQTNSGGEDAFLTKITPDGTRGWTRFLGGSGNEVSRIVITGIDSGIFVAGDTTSSTLDGQTVRGGRDAFITKYKPDGTKDWTRLLGGDGLEEGDGLAIDSNGDVYVSGLTAPTSASGQEGSTSGGTIGGTLDGQTVSGQQDAFIIKLSHSTSASATSTSVFTGLTVDLSTANATTTALASIDAALYSFTATARNVRSGLIRANRSLSYLANSGESLETAVGQVGPQPAFVADVESFSSSVEEQKRLLGEVKQVKRRLVNNFLSQYIGK